MATRHRTLCCAGALVLSLASLWPAHALSKFTNFGSVITVNDVAAADNMVWAATTGGLFVLNASSGEQRLISRPEVLPDLSLLCLERDSLGYVWTGSTCGYLCRIDRQDRGDAYTSYSAAGWDIRDLCRYGAYMLVASSRGFSIFDIASGRAVRNATMIGGFKYPVVNTVRVHNGVLYLGCGEGVAYIDSFAQKLLGLNFFDQTIWSTQKTTQPVVSFVVHNNSLQALSAPAAYSDGAHLVRASDSLVYRDDSLVARLPSAVTSIGVSGALVWLGTAQSCLYLWDGDTTVQYRVAGLTAGMVMRIQADGSGGACALTAFSRPPRWNEGILFFDGVGTWRLLNYFTTPEMGPLSTGDPEEFGGVCRSSNGEWWFSMVSSNVRRYDPATGLWRGYRASGLTYAGDFPLVPEGSNWGGTSYGLTQDNAGFIWVASNMNVSGCLIAYDPAFVNPEPGHYRRHLPESSPYFLGSPTAFGIDARNRVWAGSSDGRLAACSYVNSPVSEDVSVDGYSTDLGSFLAMRYTSDDTMWIATSSGLYRAPAGASADLAPRLDRRITKLLSSMEVESDSILWLGTVGDGLIRYNPVDSTQTVYTEANGLVSNAVSDLSIDRERGVLWIATAKGISRLDLGHTAVPVKNNRAIAVFPNPLSLANRRHFSITFEHVAPKSQMFLYDAQGILVGKPTPLDQNPYQWSFTWTPRKGMAPGTYFFAARLDRKSEVGRVMIVP